MTKKTRSKYPQVLRSHSIYGLLALAESKGEAIKAIYEAEFLLLSKIAETSSNLVKAREWKEFREINGGMEVFEKAHRAAVGAWEQWRADGEG